MGGFRSIALIFAAVFLAGADATAQTRREGDYALKDFTFHDGAKLPALSMHYVTLGDPKSPAVLVLHGTGEAVRRCSLPILAAPCLVPVSRWMRRDISSSCRT